MATRKRRNLTPVKMMPDPANDRYRVSCASKAGKPEGWTKNTYPTCNRPSGHKPPHREYTRTAVVLYEWWEEDVIITALY